MFQLILNWVFEMSSVCLISNYFPMDDFHVGYWNKLDEYLIERGITLVTLTTKKYPNLTCRSIVVPYNPFDFAKFNIALDVDLSVNNNFESQLCIITKEMDRRNLSDAEIKFGIRCMNNFYSNLIKELKPFIVFAWNSTHPQSQCFISIAREFTIPGFYIERGLLPDTLMVDSGGIGVESDLKRNPTVFSVLGNYIKSNLDFTGWSKRKYEYLSNPVDRYPKSKILDKEEFFEKYSLDIEKKTVLLMLTAEFTHTGNKDLLRYSFQDKFFKGNLDAVFKLHEALLNNYNFVVQDHPINRKIYDLKTIHAQIVVTDESIHTLYSHCDLFLFYGSTTTQIDALFYSKPIGLLSKTILSGFDFTSQYMGGDILSFVNSMSDISLFENQRGAFVSFIEEHYLYYFHSRERRDLRDLAFFISTFDSNIHGG